MDDADQKLMERLEHELCVVGILETAVHCCSCFHQDEGVALPSCCTTCHYRDTASGRDPQLLQPREDPVYDPQQSMSGI